MHRLRIWVAVAALVLPWTATVKTINVPASVAIAEENSTAPARDTAPKVDVNINQGGEKRYVVWLSNPVLLAAGGVAVLVVLLLVIMASRGGGTTIIKE